MVYGELRMVPLIINIKVRMLFFGGGGELLIKLLNFLNYAKLEIIKIRWCNFVQNMLNDVD